MEDTPIIHNFSHEAFGSRFWVRIASEEGADFIKTWYTGDPDSFAEVLRYCYIPVIVAGGPAVSGQTATRCP